MAVAKSRNPIFNHDICLRKVLECPTRCRLAGILMGILVNEDLVAKITGLVVIENNKIWRHNQKGIFATAKINNRARRKEYDQATFGNILSCKC